MNAFQTRPPELRVGKRIKSLGSQRFPHTPQWSGLKCDNIAQTSDTEADISTLGKEGAAIQQFSRTLQ